jgi:hypothetical protein
MSDKKSRIGLRIATKDVQLLKKVCDSRGEDISDFVRRAIRTELAKLSFLKPLEKKALGVKIGRVSQIKRLKEKVKKHG